MSGTQGAACGRGRRGVALDETLRLGTVTSIALGWRCGARRLGRARARIDARFDGMMAAGALQEVERLVARGLDPALPAMRAHGVPGLIRALRGDISFDEAIEKGKADTRAYSKRQHTWFRHQAPDFTWVKPEEAEVWVGDAMRLVG